MTKKQKFIVGGFILILIVLLASLGSIMLPNLHNILFPPTQVVIVIPASNTEISYPVESPTVRPTPTIHIKKPTWTPFPSTTPWPTSTIVISPTPAKVAVPTQIHSKPDCSAQYNYIESVHQYYLNYINSYYNQYLSYYESLMRQATANRDALRLAQLQRQIDQVKAQRDSEINTENARYASDRASLDAMCK